MSAVVLYGREVSKQIRAELKVEVDSIKDGFASRTCSCYCWE